MLTMTMSSVTRSAVSHLIVGTSASSPPDKGTGEEQRTKLRYFDLQTECLDFIDN